MDNSLEKLYIEVLNSYSEISEIEACIRYDLQFIRFKLLEQYFLIWVDECKYDLPLLLVESKDDYPHYIRYVEKINAKSICLFKNTEYINTLIPLKDKINMSISKLIALETLSESEKTKEYISEFPIYWSKYAKVTSDKWHLYLQEDKDFEILDVQYYGTKSKTVRFISQNLILNDDSKKLKFKPETALFIRITDLTDLRPPLSDNKWDSSQLINIMCNSQTSKISSEAYQYLLKTSFARKNLKIVFKIDVFYVACEITFKNQGEKKLIEKIQNEIVKVELFNIKRCDLKHLHSCIGNNISLLDKKILLVGCGSLGSYVLEEMVKSGLNNITVYDSDEYEVENIFRHKFPINLNGYNKAIISDFEINNYHPQIKINSNNKKFDTNENIEDVDLIIFTIGNTDNQLELNEWLNQKFKGKPVIYSWLEGDGKSSHALCTYNNGAGCYNCCFMDDNGNYINNKFNNSKPEEVKLITNYCGGTRAAYGNATLLTATFLTLKAIEDVFSSSEQKPFVYSYVDGLVSKNTELFSKGCKICNEN